MNKILTLFFALLIILGDRSLYAVPAKPNIIIVMPDDLGYGDYACLGSPVAHTPSVDAFKKESLLFTHYHASPTCSPSRAALMSGRHEFMCGVTHTTEPRGRMSLDTITMPQVLKSAGYATGIFGKWHLGDEGEYRAEKRGFDEALTHDSGHTPKINPVLSHNGKLVENVKGYSVDLFFTQALQWIDAKRKEKQPFFAYITPDAAHEPHNVPNQDYKKYLGKAGVDEDIAKFYWMIENIDTHFGELLQKLKEWGIAENTIVIYLGSDNGGTAGVKIFNAGMSGKKQTPYEGGTRLPAFVRWPASAMPSGVECDALVSHIDFFPTLLEIVGITPNDALKKQWEGRSLVPLFKNPKADWENRILVHHVGRWKPGEAANSKYSKCSIQNARFTLVDNEELYDLKADPGESKNLIAQYPEEVKKLRAAYDQWWKEVQPHLVNENVAKKKKGKGKSNSSSPADEVSKNEVETD